MEQKNSIQSKLKAYKQRYYLNLIIRGGLVSTGISLMLWLSVAMLEYFGHLSIGWRASLFFSAIAGILISLGLLFIRPALQMLGLLPSKSDEDSAKEIGNAIPEIDDKLINILTLQKHSDDVLARAAIKQRGSELARFDFTSVVNFRENLRWLKWLALPLAVMIILFLFRPEVLRDGSERIVNYSTDYTPPAPFSFVIENDKLTVDENEDFKLNVKAEGNSIPDIAFIELESSRYRLKNTGNGEFEYVFKNVRSDLVFKLSSGEVESSEMRVRMLPTPKLTNTTVNVIYPAYTAMKSELLDNRSTLRVPEGSELQWSIDVRNANEIKALKENTEIAIESSNSDRISWISKARENEDYHVILENEFGSIDTTSFRLEVVPDAFPAIEVSEFLDSTDVSTRYFSGEINDDYGFTKLQFQLQKGDETIISKSLPINRNMSQQSFNFYWNYDSVQLKAGQDLEYFFTIYDNDGVNGAKSTKSQRFTLRVPGEAELSEQSDQVSQSTKGQSEKSIEEFKKIDKELEQLKRDLLEKKQPDWQDRERMKELLEKQKSMMKDIQKQSEQQRQQNEFENKFKNYSEELMNKQQEIERMFDELFDEEFKEKWNEMNELMEKMNKSEMLEQLEKMELDNESLEKELDRTLELFKQLEFEKQLEDQIKKADELSKKMEELSEKSKDKSEDVSELKKEQEALDKELDQFEKDMEKLREKNESLEQPNELPDTKEQEKEAQSEMNEAGDNLDKNKPKNASENQKNASDEMEKISDAMQSLQQQMSESQQTENMEDLQQLLENVVTLSHEQERVMNEIKEVNLNDPKYTLLTQEQKKLIDDAQVVEDSLHALSKRVVQLDKVISKELASVQNNMDKALEFLSDQPPNQQNRYKAKATEKQQYVMTSLNNLALLLDEVMQQMQQQMAQQMKGQGACSKPGQGSKPSPSIGNMKSVQESLNRQIEKMKKAMEEGKNPNGKSPGQMPGGGMGMGSKEMAKMAAEQSAIREQLRELANSLESGENGKGSAQKLREIQKLMEQTEEELLYKQISQQTIERQQEILTRLLESEKAERERDKDDKRESKTAFREFEVPNDVWENFKKKKEVEMELYRTTPPELKPFYRNKVNSYFSELAR